MTRRLRQLARSDMGINPTAVQAATLPAVYQNRPPQTPVRPTPVLSPVSPDDVVDYVQLQSEAPSTTTSDERSPKFYGIMTTPLRNVGTIVDVWV